MTAPNISITQTGTAPPIDMSRLAERTKRVKMSIAKSTVGPLRRAELQAELLTLQDKINMVKAALSDI
jgi:hypothetical protein